MFLRFVYFIAIGWWLGILAALVAYILCLSIIGLPFGVIIFNKLPSLIFMREEGEACRQGYEHIGHSADESFALVHHHRR